MRDTRPQKESVSARSYRDAQGTPTTTAPAIRELGEAALAILARDGATSDGGINDGDRTWRAAKVSPAGVRFDVSLSGPDLPSTVPAKTAHPSDIPKERPWTGTHRLVVAAPIVAFDLYWRPDTPLRIMTFSRGDWEDALRVLAG